MGIILSAVKKMACWSDSCHFLFHTCDTFLSKAKGDPS
ncbi:hypothetical protein BSI_10560 [Bacillus inaquosorum KCTC 13429]|uniref:Uncharacterized protein n=1 Tax=Bacillus inaquosorum KCTC 13429 TaxID=1236548 RepID=A0A9W5LJR3_9BACI|nr:hypothetical protein BSI_10560 [Bacillus inaquosorum KCTC 13429]